MEEITLMSRYDLEELKKIAKYLAGLPGYEECPQLRTPPPRHAGEVQELSGQEVSIPPLTQIPKGHSHSGCAPSLCGIQWKAMGMRGGILCCRSLTSNRQKAGGAVSGGAYAPFISTVDWLGWLC